MGLTVRDYTLFADDKIVMKLIQNMWPKNYTEVYRAAGLNIK